MTPTKLKALGELMYGPRWKTDMANDLKVDRHTIIGWIDGSWTMPPSRVQDVKRLARGRIALIRAALKQNSGTSP